MLSMQNSNTVSPAAARVIEKCGGVAATARLVGRSKSWVYKWTYPKSRNGRGGVVPHEDAERLLGAAMKGVVPLTPADFFDLPAPL
jgi:hypothetical protein